MYLRFTVFCFLSGDIGAGCKSVFSQYHSSVYTELHQRLPSLGLAGKLDQHHDITRETYAVSAHIETVRETTSFWIEKACLAVDVL